MNSHLWAEFLALINVVLIDVTLAVDNAVVMGAAAADLPAAMRKRAIVIGVAAAAFCRIVFACFALRLLSIIGLALAGGILLLWVAWKLYRDLHPIKAHGKAEAKGGAAGIRKKTASQAILQIVFADVSMSLDNTLAVAGAAREHPWIMIGGLALSVALMGIAANFLAKVIQKHRWVSYVGLLVVVYVALSMIWSGGLAVSGALAG